MIYKEKIFEKNFSEIKDLQKESKLNYCLILKDNHYGIEVDFFINNKTYTKSYYNISNNKDLIMNILTYLYENSVPIENFDDVINELLKKNKVAIN